MIHWMLIVIPVLVLACNRTDGKCWYRGEGEGDYGSAAGVGGSFGVGVGVGVGAGVGGDAYYSPQGVGDHDEDEEEPICNEFDSPQIEPDKIIVCKKKAWGVDCMIACAEAGLSCPAGWEHPFKPEVGMGLLWKSSGDPGDEVCKYVYDNGDECTWRRKTKFKACKYGGG